MDESIPPPLPQNHSSPVFVPPLRQPPNTVPWYKRVWFHVILFITFPYIQVPLMWILKAFSLRTRVIVTLTGILWIVCILAASQEGSTSGRSSSDDSTPSGTNARSSVSESVQSQDSSSTAAQDDDTRTIGGTVLSVTDDGVIVERKGAEYFVNGVRTSTPSSVFFIRGHFDYVDGDSVMLKVVPAGTYRYETAIGSKATVRAFKVKQ